VIKHDHSALTKSREVAGRETGQFLVQTGQGIAFWEGVALQLRFAHQVS